MYALFVFTVISLSLFINDIARIGPQWRDKSKLAGGAIYNNGADWSARGLCFRHRRIGSRRC